MVPLHLVHVFPLSCGSPSWRSAPHASYCMQTTISQQLRVNQKGKCGEYTVDKLGLLNCPGP